MSSSKPSTFNVAEVYQRHPDIVFSEIDNETVMMDKNFEQYFGLESIGTEVWQLLETPTSVEKMAAQLCEKYDVSVADCQADLCVLMIDFLAHEMILKV